MLEPFRDEQGRSSYDLIAAAALDLPRDARILDLACGDGYLLSLLAAHGRNHLIGIDRSPEELAAARARLGQDVELHCTDACKLPLAGASLDLVVCHMALMLMPSLDSVLAEIARVLRPESPFIAVINRRHLDPAFDVYSRELRRVTARAGLDRLHLGSSDIFNSAGLSARLRPFFDESKLQIRDFIVWLRVTPEKLWTVCESMYDVFRLPIQAQAALKQDLLSAWNALLDGSGLLTAAMGLRLVRCPSRAADQSA